MYFYFGTFSCQYNICNNWSICIFGNLNFFFQSKYSKFIVLNIRGRNIFDGSKNYFKFLLLKHTVVFQLYYYLYNNPHVFWTFKINSFYSYSISLISCGMPKVLWVCISFFSSRAWGTNGIDLFTEQEVSGGKKK